MRFIFRCTDPWISSLPFTSYFNCLVHRETTLIVHLLGRLSLAIQSKYKAFLLRTVITVCTYINQSIFSLYLELHRSELITFHVVNFSTHAFPYLLQSCVTLESANECRNIRIITHSSLYCCVSHERTYYAKVLQFNFQCSRIVQSLSAWTMKY
jgi:hypothetical protein